MQRLPGIQNESKDVKDSVTTMSQSTDASTHFVDPQALDFSEAAEDKDIQTLAAIMKPVAAQLYPPLQPAFRRAPAAAVPAQSASLSDVEQAAIEEKKQIPNYIKEYLINPAFLEEYSRPEISNLLPLGRLPNKLIGDYLGYSPEHIAQLLTADPEKQKEFIKALRRLRNRLVAQSEVDRTKSAPKIDDLLTDLLFTDVEYPDKAVIQTLSQFTPTQMARTVTVKHQYWDAGFFAIHQPEAALYQIVESHFNGFQIKPEAATCVFSGLVPLSSNAVPANPMCWMFDVIGQISPGMHSKVVTYVKNGANIKVMTSLGIDHTEYQKFFGKMSTPKFVETKETVQFDATKGAEAGNVGAAHVVSKSAREAMLDGVFKYIPTPEPILIPEDHVLIFVSFQTDAWFDCIIRSTSGDYVAFNATAANNKQGEHVVLHSGDFITPEGVDNNIIDLHKQDRELPRAGGHGANNNQIVLYIPQKPGREPSHHHVAVAAYQSTFNEKIRQSFYAFAVKPTQKELEDLQSYLVTRNNLEASKLVKKLTTDVKPLFSLRSTKPYADAKASGVEPLSVVYDGQRTVVNMWGLPLNFTISASHGDTAEWGKLIVDLDRVVELDHNKAQRKLLINREKKVEKKPDNNSTISIEQLADKHDQLRQITAQLITRKIESKEQEALIFNPALLCYETMRQDILNQVKQQLMGCYIKAELENEMIQREKDLIASQVTKEISLLYKANPNLKIFDVTRELLAKKETELDQVLAKSKDSMLASFYQTKFDQDMMVLKMDPAQCHRTLLHHSIKKLAEDKLTRAKELKQELSEELDDQFTRAIGQIQASLTEGLNAFCELEAKDREVRQAAAAKAEKAAGERKESPAEKDARLAKEAAVNAEYAGERKKLLAQQMHHAVEEMVALVRSKMDDFGQAFKQLVSKEEVETRFINYLWAMVEAKLQADCSSKLRDLFKGKLPLNETDMGAETIDAKTELCRLANLEDPVLFDCTLKQQNLNELRQNPDVVAKIGKYTAFAFSIFKAAGEEVSAEAVVTSGASRPRYMNRAPRPNAS